jgi:hypothetical protein
MMVPRTAVELPQMRELRVNDGNGAAVGAVRVTESCPIYKGRVGIFGVQEVRPIVNIPADALKVRVRMRQGEIALVFVKFIDRVEQWNIEPANGRLGCLEWKLLYQQAVNYSAP